MYNSGTSTGSNLGAGTIQRGATASQQHQTSTVGPPGSNSSNQPSDAPQSNTTAAPPYTLTKIHVHNEHFSKQDFVLDQKLFPNVKPGDVFEIYDPSLPKDSTKKLIIQWLGPDKDSTKQAPVQVNNRFVRTEVEDGDDDSEGPR
jgi:hypothetical protein